MMQRKFDWRTFFELIFILNVLPAALLGLIIWLLCIITH